jgi:energy-coupling factor transporter ATP-binding protein EcfA2
MLKKIVIEHYRSCLRTSFECHPHLSVLIGPNSSGKTNVLQAMMLLNKMAGREEYPRVRSDSVTLTPRLRATFEVGTNSAHLNAMVAAFTDDSNNDVLLDSQQKWLIQNKRGKKISTSFPFLWYRYIDMVRHKRIRESDLRSYRLVPPFMYQDLKIKPWGRETIERIISFCLGMRYYGASQFTNPGACPVSFEIEKEGERSRPWRLRGHAGTLYDLYIAQKGSSHGRYDQFLNIIGSNGIGLVDKIIFREIKTSSTEYSVRVGGKIQKRRAEKVLVVPQFKCGKNILSPNQLSEGTFKTLVLLFYIITEESTALLLEEPEVCVHQGLLSSILELVKKYSKEKQMIVSTHSDYVLDHVKPENVFSVRADPVDGTVVRHIKKMMDKKEYEALRFYLQHEGNLGEYWREGGLEENP